MLGAFAKLARFACLSLSLAAAPAVAQTGVADFYRGKTVRILIGFGPGGSSAFYAEILARYMARHLPGSPSFVAQHMPGAGGLTVANYIQQRSPRDGTEFAITSRTAAFEPQRGNKNAAFDPLKFNWIGNANVENSTCISWHTSPVKKMEDVFVHDFIVGGTGADTLAIAMPKTLNKLMGTKFKLVTGYPISTDILLAIERGELNGFCGLGWTFLKLRKAEWLAEKKVSVLFQMAMEKHPDLPDVPLIQEIAKNSDDRQILELLLAPQEMGRPFFAPPDVPADRVKALRDAFAKTLADPDYLRDAEKSGIEVQYTSGEAVHELLTKAYAASPAAVKRSIELLQE